MVHIAKNESCKSHYGSRFDELKRKKNCLRKQQSREMLGKEKELKRQRESYAQNKKKKEEKRQYSQNKQSNDKNKIVDAPNFIIDEESVTSYSKDSNVLCKYCKKEFLSSSLLKHIARNESCKLFYGVEFENLKKQSISIRKKEAYDKRIAREDEERKKTNKEFQERKKMDIEKQEERKTDTNSQAKAVAMEKTQNSKEEQERKQTTNEIPVSQVRQVKQAKQTSKSNLAKKAQVRRDILDSVVSCEFCKEKFWSSSISIHIGMNKSCKEHYGSKFDEMKKERKKGRMQLYRQRCYGPGRELDRKKELYASDPKKKEKKKEYYSLNQKKIKEYKKKKYDEMKQYREAVFMKNYKKTIDEEVRKDNDLKLEVARKDFQKGCHVISQCKPWQALEENEEVMNELEEKIENKYEKFQKKIEKAFENAKDVNEETLVDKIYFGLVYKHPVLKKSKTMEKSWHDLTLSINVKFIEMAKQMGKSYPGNMICKCYKCKDGIVARNKKKHNQITDFKNQRM